MSPRTSVYSPTGTGNRHRPVPECFMCVWCRSHTLRARSRALPTYLVLLSRLLDSDPQRPMCPARCSSLISYFCGLFSQCLSSLFSKLRRLGAVTTPAGRPFHQEMTRWPNECSLTFRLQCCFSSLNGCPRALVVAPM